MPTLVPVDHDPFASTPQLVPVDHDPFADTQPHSGAISQFMQSLGRGAEKRTLGLMQLAQSGAHAIDPSLEPSPVLADVGDNLKTEGQGTGVAGAAGEILGDPLTFAPLPGIGQGGALATALKLLGQGAAVGAAGGATAPVGTGDSRLSNIEQGATTGAILAPGLYGAGKLIGNVGGKLAAPVTAALGIGTDAAAQNRVLTALSRDKTTLDALPDKLDLAGKPLAIADVAGPSTLTLGGVAARTPGEGQTNAYQFLTDRQTAAPARIAQDIDKNVSADNFYGSKDALIQQRKDVANQLYGDAIKQGDFTGEKLGELFQRPPMKQAAKEVNEIAAIKGQPGLRFYDAANDKLQPVLNSDDAQTLKEGLDSLIERESDTNPLTGRQTFTRKGQALIELKKQFLSEVDNLNPSFKAARDQYAGDTEALGALNSGRGLFEKDPEEIAKEFGSLSPSEQAFYKTGVARALKDKVSSGSDTADLAARITRVPENTNRLSQIFSPDELQSLTDRLNAEREMFSTKQNVFGNSLTSQREQAAKTLNDEGSILPVLQGAASGGASGAIRAAYTGLKNAATGMNEPVRAQLSRMLFSADPAQNQATIDALSKRLATNATRQNAYTQAIQLLTKAAASRTGMEPPPQPVAPPQPLPDPMLPQPVAKGWAVQPSSGSYLTTLSPSEEQQFQQWIRENHVPFDPSPTADYDMRGFWKGLQTGDPHATSSVNPNDKQLHFSDWWKTPYHKSFSSESQFATPDAPRWNDQDQLIDKTATLSLMSVRLNQMPHRSSSVSPRPSQAAIQTRRIRIAPPLAFYSSPMAHGRRW